MPGAAWMNGRDILRACGMRQVGPVSAVLMVVMRLYLFYSYIYERLRPLRSLRPDRQQIPFDKSRRFRQNNHQTKDTHSSGLIKGRAKRKLTNGETSLTSLSFIHSFPGVRAEFISKPSLHFFS